MKFGIFIINAKKYHVAINYKNKHVFYKLSFFIMILIAQCNQANANYNDFKKCQVHYYNLWDY